MTIDRGLNQHFIGIFNGFAFFPLFPRITRQFGHTPVSAQDTPGFIVNHAGRGYNTEALRNDHVRQAQILARIPAGRWAAPEDIQGAAVFLASAAADYVHGATLIVDGGWMGR